MICLKNGIAETSCAREKEKETRKFGLAWGKHSEIALLDTHIWRGTSGLQFQVLCTAAATDNAFKAQTIPHRSKRKDKVKMRGKTGSHPELTVRVKRKSPHCIWNPCTDCKTGQIWEQISQSFVRIDLRRLCLKRMCVSVCVPLFLHLYLSEWEKQRDSRQWLQFPAFSSFCTSSESGGREKKRKKIINKMKKRKPECNQTWVSGIICSDNCPAYAIFPKTKEFNFFFHLMLYLFLSATYEE